MSSMPSGIGISIHAPHTGSDVLCLPAGHSHVNFNQRSPYEERPPGHRVQQSCGGISIHAPHTGSDKDRNRDRSVRRISIHAPHTGSDGTLTTGTAHTSYFNPRSPYGERRGRDPGLTAHGGFQSTLPIWGATGVLMPDSGTISFQSTLPIRGATVSVQDGHDEARISIHAPHTGSDREVLKSRTSSPFQSTLPIRGATTAPALGSPSV